MEEVLLTSVGARRAILETGARGPAKIAAFMGQIRWGKTARLSRIFCGGRSSLRQRQASDPCC